MTLIPLRALNIFLNQLEIEDSGRESSRFVAKRFHCIGDKHSRPTSEENRVQLLAEFMRLVRLRWFLRRFYRLANLTNVKVCTGKFSRLLYSTLKAYCSAIEFTVSDAFVVAEDHLCLAAAEDEDDDPKLIFSPASGLTTVDWWAHSEGPIDGAYWLVEPFRPSKPLRHTGSLDHRPGHGQVAQTIGALEHFIYHYSNKTLVFADLQCKL